MPILPNGLVVPSGVTIEGSYTYFGARLTIDPVFGAPTWTSPSGYYCCPTYFSLFVTWLGGETNARMQIRAMQALGLANPDFWDIYSPAVTLAAGAVGYQYTMDVRTSANYVSGPFVYSPLPFMALPPATKFMVQNVPSDGSIFSTGTSYINVDLYPYTATADVQTQSIPTVTAPDVLLP